MPTWKAIAAMARNRVIGHANGIPWHLPADFQWFKRATTGGILVMGRRTYESIGRPLPGRETIVLSRSGALIPGILVVASIGELGARLETETRPVWICGGADIYRQLLPSCSDLYLSIVDREPAGDAFFPPFEQDFEPVEEILRKPDFVVHRFCRRPHCLGPILTTHVTP
jgi:dihydrofolate reductase